VIPESVDRLIATARRRIHLRRALLTTTLAIGSAAAGGAALLGLAHVTVVTWARPASWLLLGVAMAAAATLAVLRRPGSREAALEVDRSLGGFDRVTTALELGSSHRDLDRMEQRQIEAAAAWSERRDVSGLGPVRPPARVVALSSLAIGALLVLVIVPSVTDAALARIATERQVIGEEASRLEELAERSPDEVADELTRLVDELRALDTLDEAIDLLAEGRQELLARLSPDDLALRTALTGLQRRFGQAPVAAGASASEQLRSLAASLSSTAPEELAAAAAELRDRSADFAGVDQGVADALDAAADALSLLAGGSGSADEAGEALSEAASAIEAAEASAAEASAAAAAAAAAGEAQRRLSEEAGSGEGDSQGGGSGQGQGDSPSGGNGQGQGDSPSGGSGQGQGSGGSGGGQGGGGQSGVGSTSGGTGNGQVPATGGDDDPFARPERATVFDPVASGLGDEVRVEIDGSEPGDVTGSVGGQGVENLPLTPYLDRYAQYQRTALEALERSGVPRSLQDLVRDYFKEIEP
jgi:hypothetical protein